MKIVTADGLADDALEELKSLGSVVNLPENLESELADANILVVRSKTKATKEFLSKTPNLKLIVRAGVGLDNIDLEAAKEKGIEVRNTPGASTNAVAELTLGAMLAMVRNIPLANCGMKKGLWEKKKLAGTEIEGKTLGIIGCGRIGSLVGKKAKALGMKIIGYNPPPRVDQDFIEYVELDELLKRADIITLHVPLLPSTKYIINKEAIAKAKDGVYILNIARGGTVNEEDLYEACKSGKVRAAALDAFEKEPYSGRFTELDNIFMTPHLGASTKEAQERIGKEVVKIIKEFIG
ncbi:D-2-hydroxyacid dehydrogenase [Candidatus Micrarchaeota archaeon]|nr:D-2-hydroxyacid dehydrogenase [Candidatus Micrarchaeota archaeon]